MAPFVVPHELGIQGPISAWGNPLLTKRNVLTPHGVCLVSGVAAFLFFFILYKSSKYWSPILIWKTYPRLSTIEKRDWDVRWGNMVYPPLIVALAILEIRRFNTQPQGPTPTVLVTSDITYAAIGISVGFFIVDLSVVMKYNLGGKEMLAHHVLSFFSFIWGIYTGECHQFAMWLLLTEITTPFITMRWWLDKSDWKSTTAYVVNGLSIVLSWFVFRILLFVPFFTLVYRSRHGLHNLSYISLILLIIVPSVLTVLNLFWFSKILRGAMKLLTKGPPKKLPTKQQ